MGTTKNTTVKKSSKKKGDSTKKKIAEFKKELKEKNDRILRLLADFDNYHKRMEKEVDNSVAREKERVMLKFLDIYENLQSAYASTKDDGLSIVLKQFKRVLQEEGIGEIYSVGEKFDYKFHHAVSTEKSNEYGEGVVMKEIRKGYVMNEKVVKPAYVVVSRGDKNDESSRN